MKHAFFLQVLLASALELTAQTLPNTTREATAVDAGGFIYTAGTISTRDLPATPGVFQASISGPCAAPKCTFGYVAKLSPSGNIIWASYLGTLGQIKVTSLVVAPNQNIYVARSSEANSNLPPFSGYQSAAADTFIVEISSDGKSVLAGTYFGGAGDTGGVHLDAAGNVYLAGRAVSAQFPTTPGAYQRTPSTVLPPGIDLCQGPGDLFVAKFDAALKQLVFSTLIGTVDQEFASDLAIGVDGSLYVFGQRGFAHVSSCFATTLTHLTPDASAAVYSIAIADSNFEGHHLAVDSDGFVYANGDNTQFSPPFRGSVVKIDPMGNIVARQAIGGVVGQLALSGNDVVITGGTATGGPASDLLQISADSPPLCTSVDFTGFAPIGFIARLGKASLQVKYAGYLPGDAWLVGPETLFVAHPYASATPFATITAGPPPAGTITCVADAAMYVGWGVAPGEVVSLFGNRIGPATPVTAEFDAAGNVTSKLAGLEVLADGKPVPLLYAGPNQINLVAPFALVPGKISHLEVRNNGSVVGAYDTEVVAAHPGLFAINGSGTGPLAALNQDGTANAASNPALSGTAVALFATGLGAMTPTPADGSRPAQIANHPVAEYSAVVATISAAIEYIGNAPGVVEGVVQINVRLPKGMTPGQATIRIVTATPDGHTTQALGTIFVL